MRWAALLAVLVGAAGCQEPRHVVERTEVVGATVTDNALLGLSGLQVQALLDQRLESSPRFRLLKPGERSPEDGPVSRMTLELAFTREEAKADSSGSFAQVGASLGIRRRTNDGTTRYEVVGLGEARLSGDSLDERQDGVRRALELALDQVVGSARLQLDALDKSDKALIRDLGSSQDPRVREFALRVLAERKSPAAVPALLEKLKDSDPDEVRRAMGALVEMREVRAVPVLIEISRGRDVGFLKEILYAIGAIGGEDAQAYLYMVAQGHDQASVQDAAHQALLELDAKRGSDSGAKHAKAATP